MARRKSDIFGPNPFPKFYRDTDRAFGTSTRTKSRRSNNTDWSNPIQSYRNDRNRDSRVDVVHHNTVDVVHHDPYEDYLEG